MDADHGMENIVTGTGDEIARRILALGGLGFEEVRIDLYPRTIEAIDAMRPVVDAVHAS